MTIVSINCFRVLSVKLLRFLIFHLAKGAIAIASSIPTNLSKSVHALSSAGSWRVDCLAVYKDKDAIIPWQRAEAAKDIRSYSGRKPRGVGKEVILIPATVAF